MKLYVLSKSQVKQTAVKTSFLSDLFSEIEFYSNDFSAVSQPVDNGGKYVCRKRIETFLKNNVLKENEYVLSIENYITLNCTELAVCEMYHNNTYETVYGVEGKFPPFLLEKLQSTAEKIYQDDELIGYTNTIGKILKDFLAEDNISIKDDNWIGFYNDFDRVEQIQTAFDKFTFKQFMKLNIKSYPDFPKKGIIFDDVLGLLADKDMIKFLRHSIKKELKSKKYDAIVGLESRGFLFGMLISDLLEIPFVPVRKEGKLPGEVFTVQYKKEYGSDVFQIQQNSIKSDMTILIVDDIIATGGSLMASFDLIKNFSPLKIDFFVLGEISSLRENCIQNMKELYNDVNIFF
jgi:adenine phosphoribosyltransferase